MILSNISFWLSVVSILISSLFFISVLSTIKNNSTPYQLNWISKGALLLVIVNFLNALSLCKNLTAFYTVYKYTSGMAFIYFMLWQSKFNTYSSKLVQKNFIMVMHISLVYLLFCTICGVYEYYYHLNFENLELIGFLYSIKKILLKIFSCYALWYICRTLVTTGKHFSKTIKFLHIIYMLLFFAVIANLYNNGFIFIIVLTLIEDIYMVCCFKHIIKDKGRYLDDNY